MAAFLVLCQLWLFGVVRHELEEASLDLDEARRYVSISTQRHGDLLQSFTSGVFAFQQKASFRSIGLLSVAKAGPDAAVLRTTFQKLGIDVPLGVIFRGAIVDGMACGATLTSAPCGVSISAIGELPAEIGGLADLEGLDLFMNRKLRGDLSVLATLVHLKLLSLSSTQIRGDLGFLSRMEQMQILGLGDTHVDGTLEALRRMKGLAGLRLPNTRVRGDLVPLAAMERMQMLSLKNTNVEGTLEPLAKMTRMTHLWLHETRIGGELGSLKAMTRMTHLRLHETRIGGELGSLQAMRKLRELRLQGTRVSGSLDILTEFADLEGADLASTAVTGGGRSVSAQESKVDFLPRGDDLSELRRLFTADPRRTLLPALVELDVSGCPMNGDVMDLLVPLAACKSLAKVAASHANLTGDVLDLTKLSVEMNDVSYSQVDVPLAGVLQAMELSGNRIRRVEALNAKTLLSLADNDRQVDIAHGMLCKALEDGVRLDLTNVALVDTSEARDLIAKGWLNVTERRTITDAGRGFACYGMPSAVLQVTPFRFLPDILCGCQAGWHGRSTDCHRCSEDQYNPTFNQSDCQKCPSGSSTQGAEGSESLQSCQCAVGRIHGDSCQCDAHEALHYPSDALRGQCVDCNDLKLDRGISLGFTGGLLQRTSKKRNQLAHHLPTPGFYVYIATHSDSNPSSWQSSYEPTWVLAGAESGVDCEDPGSLATKAPPTLGHARLYPGAPTVFYGDECRDVLGSRRGALQRVNECFGARVRARLLGKVLSEGYEGPLCATCAEKYRSQGRRCKKCEEGYEAARWPIALAVATVAAGGFAFFAWWRSHAAEAPAAATPALLPLLLAQGPVLLQFLQLWGVLVTLSKKSTGETTAQTWDQEYVQWLQLTAGGLRDALSLECEYGRNARLACALLGPVLPLLLLAACAILEAFLRGYSITMCHYAYSRFGSFDGISIALQVLSLAFIGGASSCAGLLRCQELDGGGEPLGEEHAFRSLLPHLKCSEAPWVAAIGWGCTVGYGIFIPACMVGLMVKQQWLSPRTLANLIVDSKEMSSRLQLASAVAYCAVFFRGSVRMKASDGCLPLGTEADNILSTALDNKADADLQRWQAITRMLKERCIIEKAAWGHMRFRSCAQIFFEMAVESRVLAGAKELFFKYANCQSIWVEVALKLVVVGIVAVVNSFQLMFTLSFTLGTSIVLGTLKPYRQRQVNDLQCFCFLCLSVAAAGFAFDLLWLTRAALVAPVVTAATQTLRPDCRESLSLRLLEAASAQWQDLQQGGAVQLNVVRHEPQKAGLELELDEVSISTQRHGDLLQSFTSGVCAFQQKASFRFIGLLSAAKAGPDAAVLRTTFQKLGIDVHCGWDGVECHSDECTVRSLDLGNRNLTGPLLLLPESCLADLEELDLFMNRKLRGDLSVLATLVHLKLLELTATQIRGDLGFLSRMEQMQILGLADTQVDGTLEALRNMTRMTGLCLHDTHVGGDLVALAAMEQMQALSLGDTKIEGTLEPLAKMTLMTHLWLHNTRVGGELGSLQAMRELRELRLQGTRVSGSLDVLTEFADLEGADLASTAVTGLVTGAVSERANVASDADEHASNVAFSVKHAVGPVQRQKPSRTDGTETSDAALAWAPDEVAPLLPRGDDLSELRRFVTDPLSDRALLPALVELDVSGCPANGDVMDLLLPLAGCKSLAKVAAAHTNLTGDVLDLTQLSVEMDGGSYGGTTIPLAGALQVLDLSGNRIRRVEALNAHSMLSFADNGQVDIAHGTLHKAIKDSVRLDLTDVALVDANEAQELIAKGWLNTTERLTTTDAARGFACYGMPSAVLQVTPFRFLPDVLCACQAGWHGTSTDCHRCSEDQYNPTFNRSDCRKCPPGSSTGGVEGSESLRSCQCEVGRIHGDSCQCDAHEALHYPSDPLHSQCVDCNGLKLDCEDPGSLATKAPPTLGHARLYPGAPTAKKCLDPAEERCNASANASELGCVPGYEGPLCATCAEKYRSQGRRCKKCEEGYEAARWPVALAAATVAAGGSAFFAWWRRRPAEAPAAATPATPTPHAALWPLLLAQGPVLLQFLQLWGVLVALSKKSTGETTAQTWDQEYVQWLQLTAGGLRDALSLECEYGRNARLACALLGPVLPLLLLAPCVLLEAFWRGRGVSMALQVLSLAFIGGASSCAGLLRCQELDGDGEPLGEEHAFRSLLPHLKCSEAPWVAAIGWGCAVGYGIFIPACMVGLMAKQQWSLSASRRIAHSSAEHGEITKLRMVPLQASSEDSKEMSSRLQLAAAVAYCAVFFRGSVQIKPADGCLILQPGTGRSASDEVEFDADNILSRALDNKADADLQRWQAITRMLKERCIIEEAAPSDRVLAGAKELFFKYANCQSIWVEVALKLVVVRIVAVPVAVATSFQLMFTLSLTLGTSIVLGTLKPYKQRQVNDLQCFCFLCLSVAAAGFAFDLLWLTRAALVAPVVTAATQTLRPDCRESLSLRLFEAASAQWLDLQQGGAVQLNVTLRLNLNLKLGESTRDHTPLFLGLQVAGSLFILREHFECSLWLFAPMAAFLVLCWLWLLGVAAGSSAAREAKALDGDAVIKPQILLATLCVRHEPQKAGLELELDEVRHEPSEASLHLDAEVSDVTACPAAALLHTIFQKLGIDARDFPGSHCGWDGVECHSDECTVRSLDLGNRNLTGKLPAEIGGLADLEELDLFMNRKLRGDLSVLATLVHLKLLELSSTQIRGDLGFLSRMGQMQKLRLSYTQVDGTLEALRNMTRLAGLWLYNTRVRGDLVPLASMHNMRVLDLEDTKIAGTLETLAKMTRMTTLWLHNTRVGGELGSLQAMRELRELRLQGTRVSGSLDVLTKFANLEEADLASTAVTGGLTRHWRGQLKKLRRLNLAASKADFLPRGDELSKLRCLDSDPLSDGALLPALVELDVSSCPMNGDVMDLLLPLAACKSLGKVAASHANLTGDALDLTKLEVMMDNVSWAGIAAPLAGALQTLDLSGNSIRRIEALNANSVLYLADNGCVDIPHGMLRKALEDGVRLDLTNVALVDTTEARDLIAKGWLNATERPTITDAARGFACYGLPSAVLQVTPSRFLPDVLCGCQPGWQGTSTDCHRCSEDQYNPTFDQSDCRKCPPGSSTQGSVGSDSLRSCRCEVGRIHGDSCQCDAHEALHYPSDALHGQCVDCNDLKLDCEDPGSLATKAPPTLGHARLYPGAPTAKKCLDPAEERCNASANASELGCVSGYEGPLCSACAEKYRSQGRRCKKCEEGYEAARWPIALAAATVAAGGSAFFAWRSRPVPAAATPAAPTPYTALLPLLLAQGPVLLQFLQLWGVLVALSKKSTGETTARTWDQEYIQWLQLTAGGLRDALSLECEYGRNARLACALLGPVLPLLLLAACAILEAFLRGRGISMALQVLSLAFIGGASSCAGLLRCQELDGDGEPLGEEHAFRSLLPHLKCSEAPWVAAIGRGCAVGYGIFIPACMVGLMVKQQWSLAASRRIAHLSSEQGEITKLRMVPLQAKSEDSKEMSSRLQLASAVAYCAVFFRGSVHITASDGCLVLQPGDGRCGSDEVEFDADNILSTALDNKADADLQRWQAITRMLKERCIIEEASPSDRVLAGAKELFFKYANCQSIWVEVALKLVVVGIVAAVNSFQLMFTLSFTLGTSIVLGTLKPYRQRQVNDLQCFCFLCLSVAAGGFAFDLLWLTRAALVAPVVTAATQTLRPDCRESLSLRLLEAASAQWLDLQQGGAVQLNVETLSFI
ncbi:unnamed protein product [Symbiodinium sp. CCMP2592]|nr:unnamed protein product [Symbiodinium sp. CCMP2592]